MGVNTSTTDSDNRGGGVDVLVSNALVHAFVPEVRFLTTMVVVVTIMRGMYDGVWINVWWSDKGVIALGKELVHPPADTGRRPLLGLLRVSKVLKRSRRNFSFIRAI